MGRARAGVPDSSTHRSVALKMGIKVWVRLEDLLLSMCDSSAMAQRNIPGRMAPLLMSDGTNPYEQMTTFTCSFGKTRLFDEVSTLICQSFKSSPLVFRQSGKHLSSGETFSGLFTALSTPSHCLNSFSQWYRAPLGQTTRSGHSL